MKISKADMPKLVSFDPNSPIVDGDFKTLKETGAAVVSNGIQLNDVVEFPDNANDILVQVQEFNGRKSALVGVKRNGNPSWLRLASLTRRDKDRKLVCPTSEELSKMSNDAERVTFLLGKTISCTDTTTVKVHKYVGNVRSEEIVDAEFPVITIE